jgi:CRISPR-associated endonuclease/helicase Cas3
LLEDYPLKPHELLRDRSDRVFGYLKKLAEAYADHSVWLVIDGDSVIVKSLGELAKGDKDVLNGRMVLLPTDVGGLLESGMLNGTAAFDEHRQYDVADRWNDEKGNPRRLRVWDDAPAPDGMRLVRIIDIQPDADDEQDQDEESTSRRYWRWYVLPRSADDDGSGTARKEQKLAPHLQAAERFAAALAAKLVSEPEEARAVTLAAKWHDLGKNRRIWQRSIGNPDPNVVLAKSGGKKRSIEITTAYRHELGSLIDVSSDPEFRRLTPEMQDLVLHLLIFT